MGNCRMASSKRLGILRNGEDPSYLVLLERSWFMPTLNLVTELTVNDLLDVVAELDDDELAEFEARFE